MFKFFLGVVLSAFLITSVVINNNTTPDYEKMLSHTIKIDIYDQQSKYLGRGSGVILDNGFIVSVDHNFDEPKAHYVGTTFNGKTFPEKVKQIIKENHLAILTTETPINKGAPLSCEPVRLGQDIITIGNPTLFNFITTYGKVSSEPRYGVKELGLPEELEYFFTDSQVAPGMSGGPNFNVYGQVVGLTDALITVPLSPTNVAAASISIIVSNKMLCNAFIG